MLKRVCPKAGLMEPPILQMGKSRPREWTCLAQCHTRNECLYLSLFSRPENLSLGSDARQVSRFQEEGPKGQGGEQQPQAPVARYSRENRFFLKNIKFALASLAQRLESRPADQRSPGLILTKHILRWQFVPGPRWGRVGGNHLMSLSHIDVSLSLLLPLSLPFYLKINEKNVLG
uniref:Uncharacterized protein n=1 Tax=Molossus molossus TaxID=27622 RepID=A0A7J8BK91_MOLMO|nr:hypothetical protein HJG59_010159 [Molossus molossus]